MFLRYKIKTFLMVLQTLKRNQQFKICLEKSKMLKLFCCTMQFGRIQYCKIKNGTILKNSLPTLNLFTPHLD